MLNMGFKEDVETILQVRAPAPTPPPSSSPTPGARCDAMR